MLYNMWNPTHRKMLQTLKWSENGELSQLDMARILDALDNKRLLECDVTQMGQSNPNWRNGSPMQE